MRITPVLLMAVALTACGAPEVAVPVDNLATAAREGRLSAVLAQLDAGAQPNAPSPDGVLPLVAAVRAGHDTIVAELLAAGADPLVADGAGSTTWDAVMQSGFAPMAERLLLHAAREAGGGPAVMRWFAGVRGEESAPPSWQEVLSGELLPLGLMYAAHHDRGDLIATMRRGREIPNRTGYHALALAARWGRQQAVRSLLAIDMHPDLETAARTTALMEAARDGRLAVAQQLLAAGADPNHTDRRGETALHWASRFGQPKYAELLQRAGADPDRRNVGGQRPADVTLGDGRFP